MPARPLAIAAQPRVGERRAPLPHTARLLGRLARPEGSDRILERREDAILANHVGEPESVQLGPDGGAHVGDREDDAALLELLGELDQGLAARVVDVVYRVGEQDEPPGRLGAFDEGESLLGEACRVGVEETDTEAVDDEAWLGDCTGFGRNSEDLALAGRG